MKNIILSILFIGLLFIVGNDSFAQCTCAEPYRDITASNEFKLADVVFIGKVVEVTNTDHDKNTDTYIETVKFEVKRAWKQDLETFIAIRNTIHFCLNGFDKDEEFLVYAYKKKDGTFGTSCCCSRTTLLSKAAEDLKEFEGNRAQPTEIRKPRQ